MKFILTLLITVSAAAFLNAQTAAPAAPAEPVAAPAAPAEPVPTTKKIAYEVVPAKRVATPAADRPADLQPADISEIKRAQDEKKVKEAIQKREPVNNTLTPAQAPQQREAAPAESKPKE